MVSLSPDAYMKIIIMRRIILETRMLFVLLIGVLDTPITTKIKLVFQFPQKNLIQALQ